jgi:hypothetical protein
VIFESARISSKLVLEDLGMPTAVSCGSDEQLNAARTYQPVAE